MIDVKCISGDPEYIGSELASLISDGYEVMDMTTNLYPSTSGYRKETTIYLKKTIQLC